MKKYLRSRIEEPVEVANGSTDGVQDKTGQSGVIGASSDGINAHDVCQFKSLDYRYFRLFKLHLLHLVDLFENVKRRQQEFLYRRFLNYVYPFRG